jgi:hypothetical protein
MESGKWKATVLLRASPHQVIYTRLLLDFSLEQIILLADSGEAALRHIAGGKATLRLS